MSVIRVENGAAAGLESRPFYDIFNGGQGPLKTAVVLLEAAMWAIEDIGNVTTSLFHEIANPISKAASLAAPICCISDAVKFVDNARLKMMQMYEEMTWTRFEDFTHTLLNIAQRISEFVYGLIRMEIIGDAIQMVFFKGLKSGLKIMHYVYVLREVNVSDAKLHTIENDELKEWKRLENNAKVIGAISNICYHAVVITAVLFGSVVSGKIVLAVGIASFLGGVSAHYIQSYRENFENELSAEKFNRFVRTHGGWEAA